MLHGKPMRFPLFILQLAIGGAALSWALPAYAYLDPATGSIILQGILAGIAGLMVVLRMYWARLKAFMRRLLGRKEPATGAEVIDPLISQDRK